VHPKPGLHWGLLHNCYEHWVTKTFKKLVVTKYIPVGDVLASNPNHTKASLFLVLHFALSKLQCINYMRSCIEVRLLLLNVLYSMFTISWHTFHHAIGELMSAGKPHNTSFAQCFKAWLISEQVRPRTDCTPE